MYPARLSESGVEETSPSSIGILRCFGAPDDCDDMCSAQALSVSRPNSSPAGQQQKKQLSLAYEDLTVVPYSLIEKYTSDVEVLDLSHNQLKYVCTNRLCFPVNEGSYRTLFTSAFSPVYKRPDELELIACVPIEQASY